MHHEIYNEEVWTSGYLDSRLHAKRLEFVDVYQFGRMGNVVLRDRHHFVVATLFSIYCIFALVDRGFDKYCDELTRIGFDGRKRRHKYCPMNLSEAARFDKRPLRHDNGPLPHFNGPPAVVLQAKSPHTEHVSASIHDVETENGELDSASSESLASNSRHRKRKRRSSLKKRDMIDLGPHYTKGQHFDMQAEQGRAHPLFRIDGKNVLRRDTGA